MKKLILVFFLCFNFALAKNQTLLDFVPGESYYVNLSNDVCDTNCLFDLLESRMYLSFLSEFNENQNEFLSNIYTKLINSITDFDSSIQKITSVKLAIIIPEKTIKSYSNTIINSALAYLLRQRAEIKVKVFLIGTEDSAKIKQTLNEIEGQNFEYVIAGFTLKGANELANYQGKLKIFIPTLHKNTANIDNENIYFGSIDYDAQIAKLLEKANSNIAAFSDGSALSSTLNYKITQQNPNTRTYLVNEDKIDFEKLLKSQGGLNEASIFFNTPLIKTALISSQLRVFDIKTYVLLSTQINYNPTFLSLTQVNDRENFLIANSIDNKDDDLSYLNEMFNQSIDYNWISYATSVGLDYFYTKFLNTNSERIFDEKIDNSQFIYKVKLMRTLGANFEELQ